MTASLHSEAVEPVLSRVDLPVPSPGKHSAARPSESKQRTKTTQTSHPNNTRAAANRGKPRQIAANHDIVLFCM